MTFTRIHHKCDFHEKDACSVCAAFHRHRLVSGVEPRMAETDSHFAFYIDESGVWRKNSPLSTSRRRRPSCGVVVRIRRRAMQRYEPV